MATIITVHGTNATGPEFGDRWWQRGSPFETHLRELVTSDDGNLNFKPHIWDGANKETARRKAGSGLLDKLTDLETRREPYLLIGHSHGGSVIASALIEAAASKLTLPNLRSWITVGTPFITLARHRLLFSRVNLHGKAAIVSLIAYLAVFPLLVTALFQEMSFMGGSWSKFSIVGLFTRPELLSAVGGFFMMAAVPYAFLYGLIAFINRRGMKRYSKRVASRFKDYFLARWLCVWHKNDEAVCGLSSVKGINFEIFPKDFAIPIVLRAAIVLIPLLVTFFLTIDTTFARVGNYLFLHDNEIAKLLVDPEHSGLYGNAGFYMTLVGSDSDWSVYYLGLMFLVCLPLIVYALSLGAILFAYGLGDLLSRLLSRALNSAVWQQLRQRAYGNDTVGETAIDAQVAPHAGQLMPCLPHPLSNEISEVADAAAAKSIGKFRSALSELAFSEQADNKSGVVAKYLSWHELIHTSYYDVTRLRKLLAYAISAMPGFQATDVFKSDPDYILVKSWLEEMRSKSVETTTGRATASQPVELQPAMLSAQVAT